MKKFHDTCSEGENGTMRLEQLKGTARYAGFLLAPAEGFGIWPRFFLPFGEKREFFFGLFMLFLGVQ